MDPNTRTELVGIIIAERLAAADAERLARAARATSKGTVSRPSVAFRRLAHLLGAA